jgi:hypothetical protein
MASTPTTRHHCTILGKDPSEKQTLFYANFPTFRGFSDQTLDPEILEAIIITALTFGAAQDRVFLLAPVAHEDWVLEEFNKVTDLIFNKLKKSPDQVKMATFYGVLFKKIAIMGRLLQFKGEPARWVSFGFSAEDPIPEWMSPKLLR